MATISIDLDNVDPAVAAALQVILAASGQPKAEWVSPRTGRTLTETKTAHYAARIARAESSTRKGLTSKHRRIIAAELGYGYTDRQWLKAVKEFKAAGRHL